MESPTTPRKPVTIATWVLSGLLALAFLGSALGKLSGAMTDQLNAALGVPTWAVPLIGAIELVAAIALLIPQVRWYGAAVLVATMTGAVGTHLLAADFAGFIAPLVLGVLAGIIAWFTLPVAVRARFQES